MTEKELEKLFRDKLASKEVPFNPEAWDKMEQILDKEMPVGQGWGATKWSNLSNAATGIAATALLLVTVNSDRLDPTAPLKHPILPANNTLSIENGMDASVNPFHIDAFYVNENFFLPSADGTFLTDENILAQNETETSIAAVRQQRQIEDRSPTFRESENTQDMVSNFQNDDLNDLVELYPRTFGADAGSDVITGNLEIAEMSQATKALPNLMENSSIYALGGMMRARDWSGNNTDLVQTGYIFGLGLRYRFAPKWSVETGFNYTQVSDINSSFVYTVESFDFGRTTTTYHVHGHQGSFVEIPIGVVHTRGRHSFHSGAQFSVLAHKKNSVTEVRENFWTQTTQEYKQNGQMKAYRNYDVGITLAYEYSLTPALSFRAQGVYGLVDQTINSYFGQDFFARNTSLRLMLAYQLY